MNPLAKVLTAKIVLTVSAWCIPLLFFPKTLLLWLGFAVPEPLVFLRLLGMAYAALVVVYGFGLLAAVRGANATDAVCVGIVSNGGACLWLISFWLAGGWSGWGIFAQLFMWASLLGTGGITAALILFGLTEPLANPDQQRRTALPTRPPSAI
ncbi:MAG: hypothetical protein ACRETN_12415 [Nevskiales bacterium]